MLLALLIAAPAALHPEPLALPAEPPVIMDYLTASRIKV